MTMNKMTLEMLITVCYELDTELGDRLVKLLGKEVGTRRLTGYSLMNCASWPVGELSYWSTWSYKVDSYLVGSELLEPYPVG